VRGVAVVMEMKFDFAKACLRELRESVEVLRSILFAGEEPTVSRWSTVAIAELTELWVTVDPRLHARASDVVGSTAMKWFVVVAQREE
jgi:hypothetical protein